MAWDTNWCWLQWRTRHIHKNLIALGHRSEHINCIQTRQSAKLYKKSSLLYKRSFKQYPKPYKKQQNLLVEPPHVALQQGAQDGHVFYQRNTLLVYSIAYLIMRSCQRHSKRIFSAMSTLLKAQCVVNAIQSVFLTPCKRHSNCNALSTSFKLHFGDGNFASAIGRDVFLCQLTVGLLLYKEC